MIENISNKTSVLETEYRSPLQALMIRKMLGEKMHNHKAQEEWAMKYAKKISDIIDTPEHEEIRVLAREKDYESAAKLICEILKVELPDEEDTIQGS